MPSLSNVAIESLNPRHYKILDLCVRGKTAKQIADYLEMTPKQVSIVLGSPGFQHQFAIRRAKYEQTADDKHIEAEDSATMILKEAARDAADKMKSLLTSEDETISLRSATAILDRTGHHKTESRAGRGSQTAIFINAEQAQVILETMEMDKK